jgi:hypothetical protein
MSDIRIMRSPLLNVRLSAAEAQLNTLEKLATSSVADAIAAHAETGSTDVSDALTWVSNDARCAAQYAADAETNAIEVRRSAADASQAIERSVALLQRLDRTAGFPSRNLSLRKTTPPQSQREQGELDAGRKRYAPPRSPEHAQ